jgi:hypothetical protein
VLIAGIDISMTSTGIAIVDPGRPHQARIRRMQTESPRLPKGEQPTLLQRERRLLMIEVGVADRLDEVGTGRLPDIAFVEQPPFASSTPYQHDISGNWWRVVSRIFALGIPVVEVGNTKVKVYATGRGGTRDTPEKRNKAGEIIRPALAKVSKADVIRAVQTDYSRQVAQTVDGQGDDVTDAFILAAIGCRLLGQPIEVNELPVTRTRALDGLLLPEGFTAT